MLYSTLSFHRLTLLIAFALALYHGTRPVSATVLPEYLTHRDVVEDAKSKAKVDLEPVDPNELPLIDATEDQEISHLMNKVIGSVLMNDPFGKRSNTDALPDISFPSRENDDTDADVYLKSLREVDDLHEKKAMNDVEEEDPMENDDGDADITVAARVLALLRALFSALDVQKSSGGERNRSLIV
ncbi:hypothetical protein JR316_0004165 [Psilocybe cubensis]|uniref:Uncharacterized protein n=2 Tax=Psilocybe cubensis TaxID=181762 RepID=A0ACB8H2W7_PSICU|nr:hypothetical protein JR316_0004165 [Psilocybe cubensis]KAH9482070.1 hypothetical protein JR316_0004165 [Psilocybe cubensis]